MFRLFVIVMALSVLALQSEVQAAEKGDRDKAMAMLTGADALFTASEHSKAADMCRRALAEDAACPAAHFKLAQCLEQLNKPRDAFKSYQTAEELAKKENDLALGRKANSAAAKLGAGLIQISVADKKLVEKLVPLAEEALADEQLETAKQAYQGVLAIVPTHEKAKAGLEKAEKAIEARGDPVKAKIAGAMLAEVFYLFGTNKKDEAKKMAMDLSSRHGDTAPGREAAQLVANNFEPPKDLNVQLAEAKQLLKDKAEKAKKLALNKPKSTSPTPGPTAAPLPPAVDVDSMEKLAMDDAKKLPKDQLGPTYKSTFLKGKDFYSKATPGSEGNQKNLSSALEQFIRCEQLYMRLEDEKLVTDDITADQKQASMLRYACMKMTILQH